MRICVVSNRPPVADWSAEIDAADLVVRVSKCDHLDTGLVGTRTDVVILEPNELWLSFPASRRRMDMMRQVRVLARPHWWPYWAAPRHRSRFDLPRELPKAKPLDDLPAEVLLQFSTQAVAVAWTRMEWPEADLLLVGFAAGPEYERYLRGTRWYPGGEREWLAQLDHASIR